MYIYLFLETCLSCFYSRYIGRKLVDENSSDINIPGASTPTILYFDLYNNMHAFCYVAAKHGRTSSKFEISRLYLLCRTFFSRLITSVTQATSATRRHPHSYQKRIKSVANQQAPPPLKLVPTQQVPLKLATQKLSCKLHT